MSSRIGALGQVREGLAALRAVQPADLPVAVRGAGALEIERLIRGLRAVQADWLASFEADDGHEAECASATAAWLARELNLDPGEARRQVAAADPGAATAGDPVAGGGSGGRGGSSGGRSEGSLVARGAWVLTGAPNARPGGLLDGSTEADPLVVLSVEEDEAVELAAAAAQGPLWPVLRGEAPR